MEVSGEEHDDNGDNAEDDDAILDLLVLCLQSVFRDSQPVHFAADHFQRVFNLLRLQLNTAEVLLRHDVRVVCRLHARGERKEVLLVLLVVHVLDAHLVVSTVEGRKMMSHFLLVAQSFNFLATRVRDG